MAVSSIVALAGIALAYVMYVQKPLVPMGLAYKFRTLYEMSRNKFYIDEIYVAFLVKPVQGLAWLARIIDQYVIDGLVDLLAQVPAFLGYLCRPVQNGLVQYYGLLMAALGVGAFCWRCC